MKKLLLAAGALAGLAVLLLAGVLAYGARVVRSLGTPEFKRQALARASAALGTEVKARSLDVSLTRGVTLGGLEIANPRGFEGPLLTADAFVLRPRLLALLRGRIEVRRLALEKPRLALAANAKGVFNYERLGGGGAPSGAATALPLQLVLERLAVEDAAVKVTDERKATLLRLDGGQVQSRVEMAGGAFEGQGEARVATLNLMDVLFVRQARTPITISRDEVLLAPLRGEMAGGHVEGDLALHLRGGLRYTTNLDVRGASVETLLKEGRFPRAMTGTLRAKASFEGTGGMPTVKGHGRAEVTSCRVLDSKVLGGLALALHVPELANPDFDECVVEFQMAGGRLDTPSLALKGASVQLTGRGRMILETGALDYDLSLTLARPLFAKVTAREVRGAFRERGDGFFAIDFRVTGTTAAPRNDLLTRLGSAAATEALKGGIDRLFGRKKR